MSIYERWASDDFPRVISPENETKKKPTKEESTEKESEKKQEKGEAT